MTLPYYTTTPSAQTPCIRFFQTKGEKFIRKKGFPIKFTPIKASPQENPLTTENIIGCRKIKTSVYQLKSDGN